MITYSPDSCTLCGMCSAICHEGCITINQDSLSIDHSMCSTCTQCIAVCPQQALSWDHVPPERFQKRNLPTPQQMDELFRQRRTVRSFKPQRLDRETIETIIRAGVLAPTNNYHLRVVAVNDDAAVASQTRRRRIKPTGSQGVAHNLQPGLPSQTHLWPAQAVNSWHTRQG